MPCRSPPTPVPYFVRAGSARLVPRSPAGFFISRSYGFGQERLITSSPRVRARYPSVRFPDAWHLDAHQLHPRLCMRGVTGGRRSDPCGFTICLFWRLVELRIGIRRKLVTTTGVASAREERHQLRFVMISSRGISPASSSHHSPP